MAKVQKFDAAEYLDSDEAIAAYLSEALEEGDPEAIAIALGNVTRARGMTSVAAEAGVSRENLYRALKAGGRPEFATVMKVINVLGVQLVAKPKEPAHA